MTVQTVGVREFRTHLYKYTRQNNNPIKITSHGEPIGYFIPIGKRPEEADLDALVEATKKLSLLLEERNINIDELVADFQAARQQSR